MSKVLISCEQAELQNSMITPNNIKGIFYDLNKNSKIDYKINKIEIMRPIQYFKNNLIHGKWRVDYEIIPNGTRLTDAQLQEAQKKMDEKVNNAFKKANYLIHENTKVPIQIEPDDGRELPVKMDRDMGEMLYGTEVRNGRMVKKVFHAKVVGGVLDLTKIREKDLKIIREKGIHPRRFGHNRDSGRTR